MFFGRKKRLSAEEEYIAKLNREAKERDLIPPTHQGVSYLGSYDRPPYGFASTIITDNKITTGMITADKLTAGTFTMGSDHGRKHQVGDIYVDRGNGNKIYTWTGYRWRETDDIEDNG